MRAAVGEQTGIRIALSVPVAVLLVYPMIRGEMPNPLIASALLVVGGIMAVVTLLLTGSGDGLPVWWQATATFLGVGLLPVLLVAGLAAPVQIFSLLFVLVVIVGGFTYARPWRAPLLIWTLCVWLVALWWGGLRAPDLLLLHVGAGTLIAYSIVRTADALEGAARGAATAAEAAEGRAELLARMFEVHTLDREEVLQVILDGLEDVGFAGATVRFPDRDRLVLAAGLSPDRGLEEELGLGDALPGLALRQRRIVVVTDRARLDELGVEEEAVAAIAVPVELEAEPVAVVTAMTVDGPIRPYQRDAIELLASLAGRALQRARLYEADEDTVEELRRLEARTQDFISTVSHELRTPLTVVQGLGRTLHERWDELDTQRRADLLRRVDANAARLSEMVRSLLDTSAFEEGRITPELEPIELRELMEQLLHRLASVTAAHPVRVRLPEGLWVRADRPLLANVFENLLTNTAKHTPQGTRIEISAEVVADRVEITVADDGPGIPAEDLPHVRDRFYRGGDPGSRPAGGLGLGLALASQILLAHDSQLEIDSEEGEGARFTFQLQLDESEEGGTTSE